LASLKKGETTLIEFVPKLQERIRSSAAIRVVLATRGMKGQIVVEP